MSRVASEWNHLHWSTPFFDALAHLRQILIPAIFAVLGAARGSTVWLWIALFLLIPGVIISLVRFLTLRYSIRDGQLVVNQGLIFRRVRTVPVDRIQNIDFVQNILHRLFGVAEIRVETAAGAEPEAMLRVLSLTKVEQLRNEIFDLKQPAADAGIFQEEALVTSAENGDWPGAQTASPTENEFTTNKPSRPADSVGLLAIPAWWLVKAGIASNRGMVMLGILLGIIYQSDWMDRVNVDRIQEALPTAIAEMNWWLSGSLAVLGGLVALRILSVLWYLLRFYDYRLTRHGEDLRISCGLLTRVNATVPRKRIQFISLHRNWIMRWMHLSSIRIETAGGSKNHDDASQSVSSRWFVPIIPDSQVPELISHLRPGLVWDERSFDFQPISPRAARRRLRIAIALSLVIAASGLAIYPPWGWLAGPVSLPILVIATVMQTRSLLFTRTGEGIIFRSGVLTRKTSMTFFEKIQSISVVQSPLDRRWRMAKLSVDTAAAGPADHRIEIPMLDVATAHEEQLALKSQAARHQPVFT